MNNIWDKSYLKTKEERLNILKENGYIKEESYLDLLNNDMLSDEIADKLIENQIGVYSLPLGIATNFLIDGREYVVPFAIEEPSVIAGACNAAKLIKENGGFKTTINERLMCGQISLYNINSSSINELKSMEKELIEIANNSQKELVLFGGGAKKIEVEQKGEFLILYLYVDCIDAMGANTINTMLEAISPIIVSKLKCEKLMSIISNYSIKSLVKSECKIKISKEIGEKIQKAIEFANVDIFRAVTNNKGILNGIDAVLLATGNDFRAIDAAIHSYAARDGKYKSLSDWKYDEKTSILRGSLEIIMPVATFGGSIKISKGSKVAHEILGNVKAKELSSIICSVGLAQNFAALKALVTVGIQKGHMKLHAKSLAMYLGASDVEIEKINSMLEEKKEISMESIRSLLEEIRRRADNDSKK